MSLVRLAGGGVLALVLFACDAGDGPDSPSLVVYSSVDESLAQQMLGAFKADTGISVNMIGDTEAFKSTGLAARIRAEAARPLADVFWSSEVAQVAMLAREGLLQPVRTASTRNWPEMWRDQDHYWHGFSPRPRVIVWDPARLADDEVPDTWSEVLSDQFRGQVAIADPRFGTTGGHLASMRQWWLDQGRAQAWQSFLDALSRSQVQVRSGGNAATVDAVVRGEALLGMTDMDDVLAARRAGHELHMRLLHHEQGPGAGAMLTPNAVALVRGSHNKAEAEQFIDWLLSPRAARLLAASPSANMPLPESVRGEFPQLMVHDWLDVDHTAAAANWQVAMDEVLAALRGAS
ncbi:MAG: extracellular solute-binding protein [Phycisphaerales bacterium]|nr:extracellular solute-binding protein [Phycisphaerales bacterium]